MNLHGQSEGEGRIEVRAKSVEGPVIAREFCASYDKVQRFADKHGTKDGKLAVYFGVGKRIDGAKDGKKESVLSVPALWSDIDVGKHGWDYHKIVKAFHDLPGCLQPSALVHSGGGLHAYWLLETPYEFVDRAHELWHEDISNFEEVNKTFCNHTSGDNVFDVSRVLRLPGTYNARRNKECHVIWFYRWHKHSLGTLAAAMAQFDKYLGPDGFVPKDQLPEMNQGKSAENAFRYAVDPGKRAWETKFDAIWHSTRIGGGYPYYGLDEAQLLATAYLWAFESDPEKGANDENKKRRIVDRVIERTKAIKAEDNTARNESWDWDGEKEKVRYKLDRWVVKWAYMQEVKAKAKRDAQKAEREAKKAAKIDG